MRQFISSLLPFSPPLPRRRRTPDAPPIPCAPIIGLSGRIGAGKDTVAQMICELYPEYQFQKHAFADRLKKSVAVMAGLPADTEFTHELKESYCDALGMTYRELLQKSGMSARNALGADVWVKLLLAQKKRSENWIITDVRFPNELHEIQKMGGVVIRIKRPYSPYPAQNHPSEVALDHKRLPTIWNSGDLKTLKDRVLASIPEITAKTIMPIPRLGEYGDL